MSNTQPSFGLLLRRYRAIMGLTQEELAERSGLSVRGISDLERGARERPHGITVQLLAEALGLSDEDRTALSVAARTRELVNAALPPADSRSNLPEPLTSLTGRAEDCTAVTQLLGRPAVRLVNLTGPGGVGKTRLALQVATDVHAAFPDGRFFVSLAPLRDPDLVVATIAHTLGLHGTSGEPPFAKLIAHLRPKRLLLILDNFEHLLAAAPAVSELLAACPDVKVLSTSRAPLHLACEHEYTVPPLLLPEPGEPLTIERLSLVPAAALLMERLTALDPRLKLAEGDAPAIAEICSRVDGLPLAIELAAARARYLTLRELAARLQRRLTLLTHGPRDLPTRHRALRDTLSWSYDLLTSDEQRLLRWLSVFSGGWTLEGAEALCAGEDGLPIEVEDGLAALVDSSFVRAERGTTGRTRYRMLETIREFAEEHLIASGEEDAVRRRHAGVMLAFTDQAERGLQSGERTEWSRLAAAEVDNVRAALRWSLDQDETECALRIVGNLDWFWDAVARDAEGWAWSTSVLARENADREGWAYARALNAAGALAWNMGDFPASARCLTESVERFRALDDRRSLGQALTNLGLTLLYQGDTDTARQVVTESITLFETVDDPWGFGLAHFALGETLRGDDTAAARESYERSLAVFRAVGDPWGIALAITGLGGLAMRDRDYAMARALMEEGLELRQSVSNPHAIAISLTSLGELARREGDDMNAMKYLEQGLTHFRDLGDAEHVAWTLYNLGMVAIHRGDADSAAEVLAECLTLRVEQGNAAEIAKSIVGVARVAVMRGEAPCAARLWGSVEGIRAAHGVAAPADEDGEEERRTLALIHATLDTAIAMNAFAEGRALALPEAIHLARTTL